MKKSRAKGQPEARLQREEWDFREFRNEPTCEQRLACIFEYARESATIRRVFQATPFDEQSDRTHITDFNVRQFFDFFGPDALAKPWSIRRRQIASMRPEKEGQNDGMRFSFGKLHPSFYELHGVKPDFNSRTGREHFLAWIDWRANDRALCEEFALFLKQSRPPGFPNHDGTGKRSQMWYDRLERLGLMRLLHDYKPSEIESVDPDAWEKHAIRGVSNFAKYAHKARKQVLEDFTLILKEMLLPDEVPISWLTMGMRKSSP